MLQIDGSPHDWLEGRAPQMALIEAIDDATSKIICACFRPSEDQHGYLVMLRSIARRYGLSRLLYHDRHTILRSPKEMTLADELAGRRRQSQVQRVIRELGIESIAALSPQAKGRIEYQFSTCEARKVRRDHTIASHGETLQILLSRDEPSVSGKWVSVHVTPEGSTYLYDERR